MGWGNGFGFNGLGGFWGRAPGRDAGGVEVEVQRLEAFELMEGVAIVALGGIDELGTLDCIRAGASGIAAIRLFSECEKLEKVVESLRQISGE